MDMMRKRVCKLLVEMTRSSPWWQPIPKLGWAVQETSKEKGSSGVQKATRWQGKQTSMKQSGHVENRR